MTSKQITLDDLYTGQQILVQNIQRLTENYQGLSHEVQTLSEGQRALTTDVQGLIEGQQNLTEGQQSLTLGQQGLTAKLDNLTEMVTAGFETMNGRFDRVEARVDRLEARLTRVEIAQQETNDRLEKIEGNHQALYSDVIELYKMTADIKRRYSRQLVRNHEMSQRMRRIEAFIQKVAAYTGIVYKG